MSLYKGNEFIAGTPDLTEYAKTSDVTSSINSVNNTLSSKANTNLSNVSLETIANLIAPKTSTSYEVGTTFTAPKYGWYHFTYNGSNITGTITLNGINVAVTKWENNLNTANCYFSWLLRPNDKIVVSSANMGVGRFFPLG